MPSAPIFEATAFVAYRNVTSSAGGGVEAWLLRSLCEHPLNNAKTKMKQKTRISRLTSNVRRVVQPILLFHVITLFRSPVTFKNDFGSTRHRVFDCRRRGDESLTKFPKI